jgi:hypothetical protein
VHLRVAFAAGTIDRKQFTTELSSLGFWETQKTTSHQKPCTLIFATINSSIRERSNGVCVQGSLATSTHFSTRSGHQWM